MIRWMLAAADMPPPGATTRLRREAASLVHVHFATDAVKLWPIIRRLNVPIIVTLHGYDINIHREYWEQRDRSFSERRYPSRLLALARDPRVHFVAVSEAVKRRSIEYGLPAERIHVRFIGINLDRFRPSAESVVARAPRVIFVGRLVEKKGPELVIRAFAHVRVSIPDAELVIIGTGPLFPSLTALTRQLNVSVRFLGSVDGDEVRRQLDQSRVLCLPSVVAHNGDAEGLPIVVLEAQACGIPVVTSARGATTEGMVDGVTGFAFPEGDVALLTSKLTRLLSDDTLALSMADAAPRFIARRFNIATCTQSLESLYDAVVENR